MRSPRRVAARGRRVLRRWSIQITGVRPNPATAALWANIHARQPRFVPAVLGDARVTAARRGERFEYTSRLDQIVQVLRLMVVTESFFAQVCYRAKVRCRVRGIPVLPVILDRLSVITGQLFFGDHVVVQPGLYVPHGQVVLSGITSVGTDAYFGPWSGLGLVSGDVRGPTLGDHVMVGTGGRALGPVQIGDNVTIGANSIVMIDVPAGATAVGVPGRVVGAPR